MAEIKSIIWGLVFLLVLYLWISSGCRSRWSDFRERREQFKQDRKERWENFERESIFDRWRQRRQGGRTVGELSIHYAKDCRYA
jgi:hypothetical protein